MITATAEAHHGIDAASNNLLLPGLIAILEASV